VLLTAAATAGAFAQTLTPVSTRDKKVIHRWALNGDPRGVATGADGTIYVGLAEPQAVIAVNPATGAIKKRIVLDSAEIASTKELVTLRTNPDQSRLYIANGSDESATILSLPNLGVIREITMEGESIRDVVPDPRGRYIYVLGRRVHIFSKDGETEVRTLDVSDPMAIAVSASGARLAVVAPQDFGNTKASVVAFFDANNKFAELAREPLQTESAIELAMFAAHDRAMIAFSRDALFEKSLTRRDKLVSNDRVCLPANSGPQVATLTTSDTDLVYAERRCSASGAFAEDERSVTPASLYGIEAYAIAFDKATGTIVATDRAGFLTVYSLPRPVVAR
jgi:hypothetical protein